MRPPALEPSRVAWSKPVPGARVACADWLDAARSLDPTSIDLVYADPPFNTGQMQTDRAGAFADSWPDIASYMVWLRERLAATLPLIKATGSLLLHLDWRTTHHARLLLDDLLGADRFVNEIIWSYALGGSSPRRFARKHDTILFYCLDPSRYYFDPPMIPATSQRMKGLLKKSTDVLDIPSINNMAAERLGWPTQKPLALLEVLVAGCSPPGGAVFDPCCGSGTTPAVALALGRSAIASDISPDAMRVTMQRLAALPPNPTSA